MSTSEPRSEVVFFTDRDLGRQFPVKLRDSGLRVEAHADHFAHNTPDDEWLGVVGDRVWIALTHDTRIRYRPNELSAVVRHRVGLLVVVGKAPLPVLAAAFLTTVPRILAFVEHHRPPYVAKIYRGPLDEDGRPTPGTIEKRYP